MNKKDSPLRESEEVSTSLAPEEGERIPEKDRAIVENLDLLENYDFLIQFDPSDTQDKGQQPVDVN